jgi:hypothetical protein
MSDTKKRILDLLEAGKITSEEAMKLLSATEEGGSRESGESGFSALKKIKYLRVIVDNPHPKANAPGKVNVRVPVSLIRAGMKFTSLIPGDAANNVECALREKGVNLNLKNIKDDDIEDLINALRDLEVDFDNGEGKVRVYAE